jgi:hypothetical protein
MESFEYHRATGKQEKHTSQHKIDSADSLYCLTLFPDEFIGVSLTGRRRVG